MLDAYIIDRIRQQQIRHKDSSTGVPLRIEAPWGEIPGGEPPARREDDREKQERGVVIIDFAV